MVVVQEIFGVNGHIQAVAAGYAGEGYVAIAPALFDRQERGVALKYEGEDQQKAFRLMEGLSPETAFWISRPRIGLPKSEGHEVLRSSGSVTAGSWRGSRRRGAECRDAAGCCVGYYAGGIGKVAAEDPACPVMLHFGGADSHIGTEQVDAVRSAHPEVEIYVYEGAGHGFNRDVGATYDAAAAKLARERTLGFSEAHMGSSESLARVARVPESVLNFSRHFTSGIEDQELNQLCWQPQRRQTLSRSFAPMTPIPGALRCRLQF